MDSVGNIFVTHQHEFTPTPKLIGKPSELVYVVFGLGDAHNRDATSQGEYPRMVAACHHDATTRHLFHGSAWSFQTRDIVEYGTKTASDARDRRFVFVARYARNGDWQKRRANFCGASLDSLTNEIDFEQIDSGIGRCSEVDSK